ncbi:hypothetical protein Leryth_022693 [Lithospermum erythrorhizon]|nr:hypothetical protein Leryth_022693 [Lithospermum erythrorhizon]
MKVESSQAVLPNVIYQEKQNFPNFFESWISEQNQDLEKLISALNDYDEDQSEGLLVPLIDNVFQHYEHYYEEKSRWANEDVLKMLNPSWRSNFEDAFLWIGGWRPSMAFHLIYSKCGIQLEAKLSELIRGLATEDLGDLSPSQLGQIDELQRKTIKNEKEITEKHATHQETVADASMIKLSNMVSDMLRSGAGEAARVGDVVDEQVEPTLKPKEEGLLETLQMADDLRLKTLREIIKILSPVQVVHFLIAAAELHLRIHDWGKMKDARNGINI